MTIPTKTRELARELYTIHGLTIKAIAIKLGISERTITTWRTQDSKAGRDWDDVRAVLNGAEGGLHVELQHLAEVVARKIREDLEKAGGQVDDRVYHLAKILKAAEDARKLEIAPKPERPGSRSPDQRKKDAARKLEEVFGIQGPAAS